jgi:hypothetical protein
MAALTKIAEEIVSEVLVVFDVCVVVVDGSCQYVLKLTLIYCGQHCNDAINYPSTPIL